MAKRLIATLNDSTLFLREWLANPQRTGAVALGPGLPGRLTLAAAFSVQAGSRHAPRPAERLLARIVDDRPSPDVAPFANTNDVTTYADNAWQRRDRTRRTLDNRRLSIVHRRIDVSKIASTHRKVMIVAGLLALACLIVGVGYANAGPGGVPGAVTGLASSTHPVETTWYSNNSPAFTWNPTTAGSSPIAGYSVLLDQNINSVPDTTTDRQSLDFLPRVPYTVGTNPAEDRLVDLNGDGKLDLVVENSGSNTVSVLLGNGDGTFKPAVNYATGTTPWSMAVGDVNGDGKPDIVTGNSGASTASVLLNKGDGTFSTAKATVVALLWLLRSPSRILEPPARSSQSTITASNLRFPSKSLPVSAAEHTSTETDIFSKVGRRTPSSDASWLIRRDSRFMALLILAAHTSVEKVTKVSARSIFGFNPHPLTHCYFDR